MKRIYLVLGEVNVGKSSLIRCLTGVRVQNRKWVREAVGNDIHVWVYMRSMQEGQQAMSPAELVADITGPNEQGFEHYLVPLHINPYNSQPGYDAYVNALLAAGCTIVQAAVLTNTALAPVLALPVVPVNIINSVATPSNANAALVRTGWGWQ